MAAEGNYKITPSTTVAGAVTTGAEKDEDSVHVSGDTGNFVLAVRNDAGTALADDTDYIPLTTDASGNLRVVGSTSVTHTDDSPFTTGTDDGVPAFGMFNDTAPDSVDEGDAGIVRMSANRNLYETIRDADGNERGANVTAANELNVLATAQPGVDVGDVTVNNAAGASAVNIQDGGNSITVDDGGGSITVDGTVMIQEPLTVDALNDGSLNVQIGDGTDTATVTAAGEVNVLATAQPGVDIGDVTVNNAGGASAVNIQDGGNTISIDDAGGSITVDGTVATNAEYAEDSLHVSGDIGNFVLGVRNDAGTALAADGEYIPLTTDDDGNLRVIGQSTVTHTDDSPFTTGTDDGVPAFAMFDDAAPDSVDEGDAGIVRMSANRNLYSTIRDAAGSERGVNVTASNEMNVIATAQPGVDVGDVTVNNAAGASAVNIQDGGNVISIDDAGGSITVDGTVTIQEPLTVDAANDGSLNVQIGDGTDTATVTAAGEVNVIATAQPGVDIGDVTVNNAVGASAVNIQDGGNSITVDDGGGSITVDGTVTIQEPLTVDAANDGSLNVQIGDGTDTTTVTAAGELNVIATAQPGTDIGDVTVNNAAGASAVNIQDGGNSITIDGSVNILANDGVDIGDVDVTSVVPGTGATNLGKAEDAVHTTGDVGVMSLAVRNDAGTALAADGDYIPLITDSSGALFVSAVISDVNIDGAQDLWQKSSNDGIAFSTSTDLITIGSTDETEFFLIRNPASSGLKLRIYNIITGSNEESTDKPATVRAFVNPTVTVEGTALVEVNQKTDEGAATGTTFSEPTFSGGSLIFVTNHSTIPTQNPSLNLGLQIAEGDDLGVSIQPTNSGKDHYLTIYWTEETVV